MSVRPGSITPIIKAATALGVAAGLNIPLLNAWGVIPAIFLAYVATATVNNRLIVVQLKDSAGNILAQTVATTVITASQTPKLIVMAGQPYLNIATPISQILPWPVEMSVPINSSLQIFDNTNSDVADTVAANIMLVQ